MKRVMILITLAILLTSFASAEIIFNKQPNEIYNLGDVMQVSTTLKATEDISGIFYTQLVCEGKIKSLSQIPISLETGQEKRVEFDLKLNKNTIGLLMGECAIKAFLEGEESSTTNEFKISKLINLESKVEKIEFNPGESMIVKGDAFKENGQESNGFIKLKLVTENSSGQNIEQTSTINNGFFSLNITIPKDMKAGSYLVQLNAYEVNSENEETNKGFMNYNIRVKQVPTSLEIIFEEKQVEPGTSLKVKTILHDQTGQNMDSNSIITIKKTNNEILKQVEKPTDEYLEFPIEYNEAPANWTVVAVSNKLKQESAFSIKEKKSIKIEIVNETVLITNNGNVAYNEEAVIKIGNESVKTNVSLGVDESKQYELRAPDGEYNVEVISEGEKKLSQSVALTGRAIDIKEIRQKGVKSLIANPIVWIFIIAILGFVAFLIIKKGYKRSFLGKIHLKKKHKKVNHAWQDYKKRSEDSNEIDFKTNNPAHLSLSMKGEKQPSTILGIKLKNYKELKSQKGNASETLQKIINLAEKQKASTYKTGENLLFIFFPMKTKTYENEKDALKLAELIKKELNYHNKIFKQKIEFGISLTHGELIAKQEKEKIEFMGTKDSIPKTKKISNISKGEIILDEKTKTNLGKTVKATKFEEEKTTIYRIKEIKSENQEHKKFIKNFVKRMEEDKK